MNWLVWSLITLVMWGIWGIFVKLSSISLDWKQYMIISAIALVIIYSAIYLYYRPKITWETNGFYYALVAGVVVAFGTASFYLALESGKPSLVITITALYPIVTIILAYFFLHEQVTLVQIAGIVLALIAIVLMSM